MRLLHTSDLVVRDVMEPSPPPFAILSHTWDEAELSFQDLNSAHFQSKVGFAKIQESCKIAAVQYRWIWIDTCCIDKSSSAELSEAINSMYRWYAESEICYVYLADFEEDRASLEGLQKCRWFKRGWTLQELLAPSKVIFFNKNWAPLGNKLELADSISAITGIPVKVLQGSSPLHCNVAQRLSWAADRETTRSEDIAYCLLGLFDVQMVPLYGEGPTKAFLRLQEEILKYWKDHTIFIWTSSHEPRNLGLLAMSPKPFCKHRECFEWLEDITPGDPFDPYEHLRPVECATIANAHESSYVYLDTSKTSNNGPPTLGPQGLQISLLWCNAIKIAMESKYRSLLDCSGCAAICFDIRYLNPSARGFAAAIILPMKPEILTDSHSQDVNRRGQFSRWPSRYREKGYQRHFFDSFTRQDICISQQIPVPKSKETVRFTLFSLPATAKLVGSFIQGPIYASEEVNIKVPIHCNGIILCFHHTLDHTQLSSSCENTPFIVILGTHGQRTSPWCHVITDRTGSIDMSSLKSPNGDFYEKVEDYSTYYRMSCLRRLGCRHFVGVTISPNLRSSHGLDFSVTIFVFDGKKLEDIDQGCISE